MPEWSWLRWMSHLAYEWVMCHIWMSRVMKMSRDTHEWVILHLYESSCIWISHMSHMNESCNWDESWHIWMSHLAYESVMCHIWMSRVMKITHATYTWVIKESWLCRKKECLMIEWLCNQKSPTFEGLFRTQKGHAVKGYSRQNGLIIWRQGATKWGRYTRWLVHFCVKTLI